MIDNSPRSSVDKIRLLLIKILAVALCVFTVYEVNFGALPPLSQLALFALFGIVLCYLMYPLHKQLETNQALRYVDLGFCLATVGCCFYLIYQGNSLSQRNGIYTTTDYAVAIAGMFLVLEATRRSIGWALPILAGTFLVYAYFGASLPDGFFPHRGYSIERIASQCFLRTEGVFGVAMRVMFTYVFLFVVFGAFLEMSGATKFIIDFAQSVFGRSPGGPAKVSVLGSGLMGSLSGSAVANAVTTGTFTVPMMKSAGFESKVAGGINAAAASGGALVPPVMGAGAYMMLEIIDPPVTFVQIAKAAIIPAVLYYLSILMMVHLYSKRLGSQSAQTEDKPTRLLQYEGLVFFGALGSLIGFLLWGYTPFRAVTYSLEVILILTIIRPNSDVAPSQRIGLLAGFVGITFACATVLFPWLQKESDPVPVDLTNWEVWAEAAIPAMLVLLVVAMALNDWRSRILDAFMKAARGGISLVAASACVGIVIGVVGLTGVGTAFPNAIVPLAEQSLLLALIAIMLCSIVLGMGLPSAVCYLLMATLIGPVLNKLGVTPLAAHLFIFYFGMMSMVTPPVALAAYASASISKSKIMPTAICGFQFALVGFTLPYMFVYRTELLLLHSDGTSLGWGDTGGVVWAIGVAVVGILALATGVTGFFHRPLSAGNRTCAFLAAASLLLPEVVIAGNDYGLYVNLLGGALFLGLVIMNLRSPKMTISAA